MDTNNASIVLRMEYKAPEAAKLAVVILGGDAQFLIRLKIVEEHPSFVMTQNPELRIQVTEAFNPLNCKCSRSRTTVASTGRCWNAQRS